MSGEDEALVVGSKLMMIMDTNYNAAYMWQLQVTELMDGDIAMVKITMPSVHVGCIDFFAERHVFVLAAEAPDQALSLFKYKLEWDWSAPSGLHAEVSGRVKVFDLAAVAPKPPPRKKADDAGGEAAGEGDGEGRARGRGRGRARGRDGRGRCGGRAGKGRGGRGGADAVGVVLDGVEDDAALEAAADAVTTAVDAAKTEAAQ